MSRFAKQVIVVRKDLKMPIGKVAAQIAHASMAVILNKTLLHTNDDQHYQRDLRLDKLREADAALIEWIDGAFTKVVLGVDSEEALMELYTRATSLDIPASKIVDSGRTVFNGVPTLTCCAFGPHYNDVLDALTGHLKLLNK